MLETLYGLFTPTTTEFSIWYNNGFVLGFVIMFFTSILLTVIYYLVIGRITRSFASLGWWLTFLFFTMGLVFLLTALLSGFVVFENVSISDFQTDIWVFSALNATVYTGIWFLVLSFGLNNLSLHNRYLPFNLFR